MDQLPKTDRRKFRYQLLLVIALCIAGCDRGAGQVVAGAVRTALGADFVPRTVTVGALVRGVWLPAGLANGRTDFGPAAQQLVLDLNVNFLEWLQRDTLAVDELIGLADPPPARDWIRTEELAMRFAEEHGLGLPVYYEPLAPGFGDHDKLENWSTCNVDPQGLPSPQCESAPGFADSVARRVRALKRQWGKYSRGFQGYLISHEQYDRRFFPALGAVVGVLRGEDAQRPALAVAGLHEYGGHAADFLDRFFQGNDPPNIFQHEHYVFRGDVCRGDRRKVTKALDGLLATYNLTTREVGRRAGRWHAVIQAHSELRSDEAYPACGERSDLYYRYPTVAEIRVQAGLALSRGASGVVYFVYSSGSDPSQDHIIYRGLVDAGVPTAAYAEVRALNDSLERLSAPLKDLYYHGWMTTSSAIPRWVRTILPNDILAGADRDLELGFFGDGDDETHLLVVNRRTDLARGVELVVKKPLVTYASTGEPIATEKSTGDTYKVEIPLEPGGFRLLVID
ncbi:MAG: hypothetical protein VX293_12365 [Candidatus Latescibacterota bacterium]|nr:hypothetical protein [Candidatus Latescibacterota bacterium]